MTWGPPFLASFARNGNFVFADRESRAYGKGETPQAREGHEFHQCHISPARVERTLLSAAFDLDPDLSGGLTAQYDNVEEWRFSATQSALAARLQPLRHALRKYSRELGCPVLVSPFFGETGRGF